MRSASDQSEVARLISQGLNDSEISRRTGVPRSTVRGWRLRPPRRGTSGRAGLPCDGACGSVDRIRYFGDVYAFLLGHYLGDGTIDLLERGVTRLRVTCMSSYPGIIDQVAASIVVVSGKDRVGFARSTGCLDVNAYWKHWPCVFPQHGPGRKHERPIILAPWQTELVGRHAADLVRGLFQSDGCRAVNRVWASTAAGRRSYEYTRYQFSNASKDILGICGDGLDQLGISWRPMGPRNISVARRADVAALERIVGAKS